MRSFAAVHFLLCFSFFRSASEKTKNCSGQIDGAHFQPTEVGFVVQAEAFRPAGGRRRMCSMCLTTTQKEIKYHAAGILSLSKPRPERSRRAGENALA